MEATFFWGQGPFECPCKIFVISLHIFWSLHTNKFKSQSYQVKIKRFSFVLCWWNLTKHKKNIRSIIQSWSQCCSNVLFWQWVNHYILSPLWRFHKCHIGHQRALIFSAPKIKKKRNRTLPYAIIASGFFIIWRS